MSPRIVYYRLPEEAFFALPMWQRAPVEHWSCIHTTLCSSPKVQRPEEHEQLTALGCTSVDITDQYAIGWTTAPASYDHGCTLVVETRDDRRLVAVHITDLDWQNDRYLSGAYGRLEVSL